MPVSEQFRRIVASKAINRFEYNAQIGRIVLNNRLTGPAMSELQRIAMSDFGYNSIQAAFDAINEASLLGGLAEPKAVSEVTFVSLWPGDILLISDAYGFELSFLCISQLKWACLSDSGQTLRAGDIAVPMQMAVSKGGKFYAAIEHGGCCYPNCSELLCMDVVRDIKLLKNSSNRLVEYQGGDLNNAKTSVAGTVAYADYGSMMALGFDKANLSDDDSRMFVIDLAARTYDLNPNWDIDSCVGNEYHRDQAIKQLEQLCEADGEIDNIYQVKSAAAGEIMVDTAMYGMPFLRIVRRCTITVN